MSIGYACVAVAVQNSAMKSCTLKNATTERLLSLVEHNLSSLENLIDYNSDNGIKLFRISSDIIPFGSSLAAELPWNEVFSKKLDLIGKKIAKAHMRVSMHPGQYTVLNSTDTATVERSIKDLTYHTKFLDSLGLDSKHKLILHMGGAYGNKTQAKERFVCHYGYLDSAVTRRLVLENDDSLFNISDVLETSANIAIPAVFDNLHNLINPADKTVSDNVWINLCAETWTPLDGKQKIHYSQQSPDKRPGAHSESVDIDTFQKFFQQLNSDIDIMLEVKDKNMSALKCLNCVSIRGVNALEAEWARYKYLILERSAPLYLAIRELLRDKSVYNAIGMYRIIEEAMTMPLKVTNAVNAAQHVWGYFKDIATEKEKKRFAHLLTNISEDGLRRIKTNLFLLAKKYQQDYLLNGYYFYK
ncbi:MAG: UV DNA damage repair endonuclease UvsE [Clostridia bacterium]|nr:UV DNA damage repair endonuclease UvsE [Clostridia bacterium]